MRLLYIGLVIGLLQTASAQHQGEDGRYPAPAPLYIETPPVVQGSDEMPLVPTFTPPVFPGCRTDVEERATHNLQCWYAWAAEELKYPSNCRTASPSGWLIVKVTITRQGQLINPTIYRSLDPQLDAEVLRVVQLLADSDQRWTPAKRGDQPVAAVYYLPLRFLP